MTDRWKCSISFLVLWMLFGEESSGLVHQPCASCMDCFLLCASVLQFAAPEEGMANPLPACVGQENNYLHGFKIWGNLMSCLHTGVLGDSLCWCLYNLWRKGVCEGIEKALTEMQTKDLLFFSSLDHRERFVVW